MLSIRAKIISGFVVIFAISMVIGVYGLYSINKMAMMSSKQAEIQAASSTVSDVLEAHYIWRQNLTIAVYSNTEFTGSYDPNTCALGEWRNSDGAKVTADAEILSLLEQIDEPHYFIHTEAQKIMNMMKEGRVEEARGEFTNKILPNAGTAISLLGKITERYGTLLDNQTQMMHDFQNRTITIIIGMIIAITILSVVLAVVIIKSILKPLKALAYSANMVADGNFNVNLKHSVNDEIGKLTESLSVLVNTFRALIGDMNKMAEEHTAGDMDYFMDSSRYNGEFQNVISSTNLMVKEYTENILSILGVVQKYADGDFSAKIAMFPGKKAMANTILDAVSENLKNVEYGVMSLVKSALDGKLDKRIDASGFKGGWREIVVEMNELLEAVDAPLAEAQKILSLVSEGKLDVKIDGKYNGEFEKMSTSINKTIETFSTYISEISTILNNLASDNFNIEVTREYIGSFSDIKNSLNAIIARLNNVMYEIGVAADQVATGSVQISQTSMTLSQGAVEQASSVQELNATIEEIHAKTIENAENSTIANKLVAAAKNDAENGNTEMKDMLNSMTEINAASHNISKIIKVIEDIAFQTNLLALNAAVEAARAGEHGKGFAVVAEEVRNLAARSQSSAKETASLIEHSMAKVDEGTRIANSTAQALLKIVEGVDNISDIITKIEASSKEQATSIAQINEGIGHISQVTQGNSSTSEESAAAAEELSSQSEMLKSMISKFELKINMV